MQGNSQYFIKLNELTAGTYLYNRKKANYTSVCIPVLSFSARQWVKVPKEWCDAQKCQGKVLADKYTATNF